MRTIDFPNIRNITDLAKHLSCTESDIQEFAFSSSQNINYLEMTIRKKNGSGCRTVYKSKKLLLSLIHKNLETAMNQPETFPDYVQGFVKKGSIAKNAKNHLAKKCVLNADIANFFESVGFDSMEIWGHIPVYLGFVMPCLCLSCAIEDNFRRGGWGLRKKKPATASIGAGFPQAPAHSPPGNYPGAVLGPTFLR